MVRVVVPVRGSSTSKSPAGVSTAISYPSTGAQQVPSTNSAIPEDPFVDRLVHGEELPIPLSIGEEHQASPLGTATIDHGSFGNRPLANQRAIVPPKDQQSVVLGSQNDVVVVRENLAAGRQVLAFPQDPPGQWVNGMQSRFEEIAERVSRQRPDVSEQLLTCGVKLQLSTEPPKTCRDDRRRLSLSKPSAVQLEGVVIFVDRNDAEVVPQRHENEVTAGHDIPDRKRPVPTGPADPQCPPAFAHCVVRRQLLAGGIDKEGPAEERR